jgi:hypothetical protein
MAQVMISVDARGHIQWQDYFGPKERRKRQSKFILLALMASKSFPFNLHLNPVES